MKKDIFSIWLKEFCALVFTQTIQAFLLAAIMSVVVATAEGNSPANTGSAVSATGIIAIIALTAISKIEAMVKKIFGIESQFGDPSMKSGMAGLAGTIIGAKLAGRVLNNVGKIGGGIGEMRRAKQSKVRAQTQYARDLAKLNAEAADPNAGAVPGIGTGATTAGVPATRTGEFNMSALSAQEQADMDANLGIAAGAVAGGTIGAATASTSASGGAPTIADNVTLAPNTVNLTGNPSINAGTINVEGGDSETGLSGPRSNEEKLQAIKEKYEDAIEKAKDQRRAGAYKTISGVTESALAVPGAVGGAIVGAATGTGALKTAGMGMGVADYVGEMSVNAAKGIHQAKIDRDRLNNDIDKLNQAASQVTHDPYNYIPKRVGTRKINVGSAVERETVVVEEKSRPRPTGTATQNVSAPTAPSPEGQNQRRQIEKTPRPGTDMDQNK